MSKPAPPPPPEVLDALRRGDILDAIKRLRAAGGNIGLAEAKRALEWHMRQNKLVPRDASVPHEAPPARITASPRPPKPSHSSRPGLSPGEVPRSGGVTGVAVLIAVAFVISAYVLFS